MPHVDVLDPRRRRQSRVKNSADLPIFPHSLRRNARELGVRWNGPLADGLWPVGSRLATVSRRPILRRPGGLQPTMAAKQIHIRSDAREKVLRGAAGLADAVRVTLGPKARCVLIERKWGRPLVSDDGVFIAKQVGLQDADENLGVQM